MQAITFKMKVSNTANEGEYDGYATPDESSEIPEEIDVANEDSDVSNPATEVEEAIDLQVQTTPVIPAAAVQKIPAVAVIKFLYYYRKQCFSFDKGQKGWKYDLSREECQKEYFGSKGKYFSSFWPGDVITQIGQDVLSDGNRNTFNKAVKKLMKVVLNGKIYNVAGEHVCDEKSNLEGTFIYIPGTKGRAAYEYSGAKVEKGLTTIVILKSSEVNDQGEVWIESVPIKQNRFKRFMNKLVDKESLVDINKAVLNDTVQPEHGNFAGIAFFKYTGGEIYGDCQEMDADEELPEQNHKVDVIEILDNQDESNSASNNAHDVISFLDRYRNIVLDMPSKTIKMVSHHMVGNFCGRCQVAKM